MSDLITDVPSFLAERKRKFLEHLRAHGLDLPSADFLRYSVKDLGGPLALGNDEPEDEVNETSLQIVRTITTPSKDRYGDVVVPRGCEPSLPKYMANPQVFFGHKSYDLPIARTLKLEVSERKIRATAQFHEETDEARVVWRLCSKGLLPGTSIGFLPSKASLIGSNMTDEELLELRKKRKEETPDGEKVIYFEGWMCLRFLEWELLEWSVVSVPANPECVEGITKCLSDGCVEGEPIPLSLRKSLEPYALRAKIWSPGFDPQKVKYSGVLMLGQEEMEFEDGALKRIGEFKMGGEEEPPADVTPEAEEETPAVSVYESLTNEAPGPVLLRIEDFGQTKEGPGDALLKELLGEMRRHHAVEEAHQAKEEAFQNEVCGYLKEICSHVCPAQGEEPKSVPPSDIPPDQMKSLLEHLTKLSSRQEALGEKFFSLTGRKV